MLLTRLIGGSLCFRLRFLCRPNLLDDRVVVSVLVVYLKEKYSGTIQKKKTHLLIKHLVTTINPQFNSVVFFNAFKLRNFYHTYQGKLATWPHATQQNKTKITPGR